MGQISFPVQTISFVVYHLLVEDLLNECYLMKGLGLDSDVNIIIAPTALMPEAVAYVLPGGKMNDTACGIAS